MKNKRAFTLTEIVVAMIIVMIISAIIVPNFKPKIQKLRFYAYATIMNIQKGNSAVMERYLTLLTPTTNSSSCAAAKYSVGCKSCSGNNCTACYPGYELDDYTAGGTTRKVCSYKETGTVSFIAIAAGYDGYCLRLADNFTLKQAAECKQKSAGDETVNMVFANGSTLQGLSTPWIKPYTDSEVQFKNIVLDIDGEKGANKVWVDRVPLRIFAGDISNGTVMPVSCKQGEDVFYNGDTKVTLTTSQMNPYCKQKFDASGAWANKNFMLDDQVVSFDVYRLESTDENAVGKLVFGPTSLMRANCSGYGDTGMFHKKICASYTDDSNEDATNKKGYRIDKKCITKRQCNDCWKDSGNNICPRNDDGGDVSNYEDCMKIRDTYNPEDISCFMLPHKPSVGASFMVDGIMDSIDM